MTEQKLFDALGGYTTLQRVHKIFYDKVYAHPWLKHFFLKHDQDVIERQQTSFMAEKFAGPDKFCGMPLKYAHEHMYITNELVQVRQQLLHEALNEAGIQPDLIERWLRIDSAFHKQVVKPSKEAFYAEHTFKARVIVEKPLD